MRLYCGLLLCFLCGCDGAEWSLLAPDLDRVALSVWASGREVYVVGGPLGSAGESLLLQFEGPRFVPIPLGTTTTLWWVFGLPSGARYAVGEQGTVLQFSAASAPVKETTLTDHTLYGIWGADENDLWAVGGQPGKDGVLLHKDTNGWQTVPAPVPFVAFFKVWGSASDDVFVCGEGGTILHYDGKEWAQQSSGLPPSTTLFTVAGRAADDVYAVGGFGQGIMLHYNGRLWQPVDDPALVEVGGLAGVGVDTDGSVVVVGASGTKLRGMPGALQVDSNAPPHDDLHATFIAQGHALAVGGNYLAPPGAVRHGVVADRR